MSARRVSTATGVTAILLAALVLAALAMTGRLPGAQAAPVAPAAVAAPAARPAAPVARPAAPPPAPRPAAPPPGPPVPGSLARLPASTTQAVVVSTPSPSATRGQVSTWRRVPGGWAKVLGPVPAAVGAAGTGAPSESVSRTPEGAFGLTRTFGRAPNPGTAMPWFHAGPDDWWVSDPGSRAYNTHQTCRRGTCPFDERRGENLDAAGAAYDDAAVIDANTNPVAPGRGSAFFLHVGSTSTAGCVATDRATVVGILRWLNPGAHPMITIGR